MITQRKRLILLLALVIALASSAMASAQSGGVYNLEWNTIDGGGYMASTGGVYRLSSTIGQPEAGTLSGGVYILSGGFWSGAPAHAGYLPMLRR